ncbi:hypothetical protein PUN4_600156 [Paraburkholderia unamae]|nr:hypothetical protein PUN4_600156 [Paraburkholderia unamae]
MRRMARYVHPVPIQPDLNLCVFSPPANRLLSFLPPSFATSRSQRSCPPRFWRAQARSPARPPTLRA